VSNYVQVPDPAVYYRAIWPDIQSIYAPYNRAFPENVYIASRYAYYACLAEKWVLANQLLKQLGDRAVPDAFDGAFNMNALKAKAAEHLPK
jgi:hypothetical protein